MNIGEVSKAVGISAKMIRYYEDVGLIPVAQRSAAGYRTYTAEDVHRLGFVRRARDLGFSMDEITDLLSLWNDRSRKSVDVKRLAQAHITELESRIENLRQIAGTLQVLIDCCAGDDRPDCPILDGLEYSGSDRPKGGGSLNI